MQLIDTHSHIYLKDFESDIDEVIQRALDKGVEKIVLPNIDAGSLHDLYTLVDSYPDICIPLHGLHPTHARENYKNELTHIFKEVDFLTCRGIGEIGIDLYWDKTFFREQKEAFRYQLFLAKENNLPVVIHARDSFREILDIIKGKEFSGIEGIFHAFTGNLALAREIIDLGFLLGIGGIVTFKNSHLAEVVKDTELGKIVLETDSPYLAPVPHRGKRNESSYIKYVAESIAMLKEVTIAEVADITTANAKRIFRL